MDKTISVKNFSITPGTRHSREGHFSGEEFRKQIEPDFKEALTNHVKLIINLDNTIGYGTSWLEEVFGGLARTEGKENVLKTLDFISEEEPYLINDVKGYISAAN